ncbi:hypothetical protein SAMN06265379_10711 [Saccharicrinis carchari]|uniref:Uncharacterized protein n=1 Tax=Saccharicrinis carchari TaxID=1168039 RepID=A0A521DXS4_SACCC|nr:hypothetical protein [Saccharicrinis carchari]SMO76412.1 hypothetical protein SAMN06265379_10711 [Saccharicrinis carchari]
MKKKLYTKPELSVTIIDNDISLVMMTDENNPPDKPVLPAAGQNREASPSQKSNFNENPFGE